MCLFVTRGDALRACPWLLYVAPLALKCIYAAPLALQRIYAVGAKTQIGSQSVPGVVSVE